MAQAGAVATSSASDGRGQGGGLAAGGRVRLREFLTPELCAALREAAAGWRAEAGEGFACGRAELPAALGLAVRAALAEAGLEPPADLTLVRHGAGERGLPPGVALVIDLNPAWRSEDGGLLLFDEGGDRTVGWRPEAGALTLFDAGRPPVLSLVAPSAPGPRLAVMGGYA